MYHMVQYTPSGTVYTIWLYNNIMIIIMDVYYIIVYNHNYSIFDDYGVSYNSI